MVKCYTSASQITRNIKELLVIKDSATKLITHQEAVVQSSKSINTAKDVEKQNREKRQENSESVTCATYITQVKELNKVFTQSSLIGSQATIVSLTATILKQTVQPCTAAELTVVEENIQVLGAVIKKINDSIVKFQTILLQLQPRQVPFKFARMNELYNQNIC